MPNNTPAKSEIVTQWNSQMLAEIMVLLSTLEADLRHMQYLRWNPMLQYVTIGSRKLLSQRFSFCIWEDSCIRLCDTYLRTPSNN